MSKRCTFLVISRAMVFRTIGPCLLAMSMCRDGSAAPPPFPGFDGPFIYELGDTADGMRAGDLNGDGVIDLAVASGADDGVFILRGVGDGSFLPATFLPVGQSPFDLALADFDVDGDLDMAVADAGAGGVWILRNDGRGAFAVTQGLGTGSQTQNITTGDVDGDGDIDIAVANLGSNTASVLRNQGAGVFSSAATWPVGSWPSDIELADLDGDGDLDIVTADTLFETLSIRRNDGAGAFDSLQMISAGLRNGLTIADIDLDGDNDALLGGTFTVLVWHNVDGSGLVENATSAVGAGTGGGFGPPIVADFNLDGLPDVLASNTPNIGGYNDKVQAWIGLRGEVFHALQDVNSNGVVNGGDLGILLAAWVGGHTNEADFNFDGVVNGADLASLLARWGPAPLAQTWLSPEFTQNIDFYQPAVADFDGDGDPDFAISGIPGVVAVFLNRMIP